MDGSKENPSRVENLSTLLSGRVEAGRGWTAIAVPLKTHKPLWVSSLPHPRAGVALQSGLKPHQVWNHGLGLGSVASFQPGKVARLALAYLITTLQTYLSSFNLQVLGLPTGVKVGKGTYEPRWSTSQGSAAECTSEKLL